MISIKCGNDLLLDERLSQNPEFQNKVFHPSERKQKEAQKLAGIFALKESVIKALELPAGQWLEIEVKHQSNGKPYLVLSSSIKPKNLQSIDCSVSHENGYTLAHVIFLLEEK